MKREVVQELISILHYSEQHHARTAAGALKKMLHFLSHEEAEEIVGELLHIVRYGDEQWRCELASDVLAMIIESRQAQRR